MVVSCDDGTEYVSVGDKMDGGFYGMDGAAMPGDGGMDAARANATDAPDGALAGFPDGSLWLGDGAVLLPDGRVLMDVLDDSDGGREPEIDVSTCGVGDDDRLDIDVPFVEGGFALTPGLTGFGLAYWRDGTCRHVIDTALVPSTGPFLQPVTVLDDCRTIQELDLVYAGEQWHMAWTDNFTDTLELHKIALDGDLKLPVDAERTSLTDNTGLLERRPSLAVVDDRPMLAWYSEDLVGGARSIHTTMLDAQDGPTEVVAADAGHRPIELALAQTGAERAVLAWVEEVAQRGIWLQRLDADGAALGEPSRLTDYAGPGSTVDLATRYPEGGAAVYSVVLEPGTQNQAEEVRFRRFDQDGVLKDLELKVVSRPLQARDASLTRVGGGYAVAYRALPAGVVQEPEVRLTFISKEGNPTLDREGRPVSFPLAPAALDGSRLQVRLSSDGLLAIAYVDGSSKDLNRLHVIRRTLNCN